MHDLTHMLFIEKYTKNNKNTKKTRYTKSNKNKLLDFQDQLVITKKERERKRKWEKIN